jgi:hypothetical protein
MPLRKLVCLATSAVGPNQREAGVRPRLLARIRGTEMIMARKGTLRLGTLRSAGFLPATALVMFAPASVVVLRSMMTAPNWR